MRAMPQPKRFIKISEKENKKKKKKKSSRTCHRPEKCLEERKGSKIFPRFVRVLKITPLRFGGLNELRGLIHVEFISL